MSEDKNINVSVVPKFAETALENVLDKPSKSIGETFSDIWYLVLGGALGQMAEKRKMKYVADLEKYKKKIEEEIEKIPDEKRCQPDMQIIGTVLEASKYCAEKEELRCMFAKLVAANIDLEKCESVHPIYADTLKNMSVLDAKLFSIIATGNSLDLSECTLNDISISITYLKRLKLIQDIGKPPKFKVRRRLVSQFIDYINDIDKPIRIIMKYTNLELDDEINSRVMNTLNDCISGSLMLTDLGEKLQKICL